MKPARPPSTFTRKQAQAAGLSKHALYRMRDRGELEQLARGLFRRRDAELVDEDLLEIAVRCPKATLCLQSALAHHGLSDAIPPSHELALPRGTRAPVVCTPVQWHWFEASSFELGRAPLPLDEHTSIGLYSAERSIVDAFRLRGREGHEVANEALKRWLRRRGSQPSALLELAKGLPRSEGPLRHALEVLL
jgi:hypothetical protein